MDVLRISTVLLLASFSLTTEAATRYITDNLSVPLRDGPSVRNKVLKNIKSGTRVEFIVDDKESGYSLVKIKGVEGWIKKRHLSRQPSARIVLKKKEEALKKLQEAHDKLKQRMSRITAGSDEQVGEIGKLRVDNERLQTELAQLRASTSDVVAINAKNQKLTSQLEVLKQKNRTLENQNAQLRDVTAKDWFIRGAGVILAGILVGLILPRLRWRKRNRWSDGF